jgi:hypothetical protein
MSFEEFIKLVTKEQPSLDDVSEIIAFAEKSDTQVIWDALQKSGIHAIVIALLTNVLQHKIQSARSRLGMPPQSDERLHRPIITGDAEE